MKYKFSWSKEKTFRRGLEVIKKFLYANNIEEPVIIPEGPPHATNEWQNYGLFTPQYKDKPTVWVNVNKSTKPQEKRGRIWTFPGHKTDRSSAGILAHEIGHYISWKYNNIGSSSQWVELCKHTKKITSYAPTYEEEFAETMRLFILNPELLWLGRSLRYAYIVWELPPIIPVGMESWRKVLKYAPSHIVVSASKFVDGK